MPEEPGKYNDLCTEARMKANAVAAVLLIMGGDHGNGFSVQAPVIVLLELPRILRQMADDIEQQQSSAAVDKS